MWGLKDCQCVYFYIIKEIIQDKRCRWEESLRDVNKKYAVFFILHVLINWCWVVGMEWVDEIWDGFYA